MVHGRTRSPAARGGASGSPERELRTTTKLCLVVEFCSFIHKTTRSFVVIVVITTKLHQNYSKTTRSSRVVSDIKLRLKFVLDASEISIFVFVY